MKRLRLPLCIVIALSAGAAIFWLVSTSRAATETPEYKVIRTDGKFEIRDYPAMTVASTPMESGEMNRGFGQLFKFITGANETKEKIEMTSPVLIETVNAQPSMNFIMPRAALEKGVPKPAGGGVSLRKIEAARFAVLRFDGARNAKNEADAAGKLREWLGGQKIAAEEAPIFAYYDPPWTPIPLRRNEVMLRIGKLEN